MRLLLDTHLLLWAAAGSGLSDRAADLIADPQNKLWFSPASIWEIAIKSSLGKADFAVEAGLFRRELLDSGYEELPITSAHAAGVATLPDIHRDPFDRMLIAQAIAEGVVLLTTDRVILQYPGPIQSAI
ncbi:MAG: type II toxin-antitoxin system VapC family toxin [Sphingomonas sp.]|nr:type II toxin-antitoxin system VapC family toxin [Sphingomonas sp.]